MPCHAAMIDKPLTLSPDIKVEKAIKELKKKKTDAAAVINDDGVVIGLFSLSVVMQNLLPVSVAVSDGIQLDIPIKAAPGIAKRLKKIYPLSIEDVMERKKLACVLPDTPIWECVNKILITGGPVFVVEDENMKLLGLINELSVFEELQRLQESEGA